MYINDALKQDTKKFHQGYLTCSPETITHSILSCIQVWLFFVHLLSIFHLDFYFPFLFGLLFWTFISLFYMDFFFIFFPIISILFYYRGHILNFFQILVLKWQFPGQLSNNTNHVCRLTDQLSKKNEIKITLSTHFPHQGFCPTTKKMLQMKL